MLIKLFEKYVKKYLVIIVFLLFPIFALAHGGDDHEHTEDYIPVAQSGKLNTKLAKTSYTEILVKYPTPVSGIEIPLRAFLTDINNNNPIENAKLSLVFSLVGDLQSSSTGLNVVSANATEFQVEAKPSNIVGIYQASVTFPKPGNYQLKLKISGDNLNASAQVSGLIVNEQIIESKKVIGNSVLIIISSVVLLALISMGAFFYKRQKKALIYEKN
jgi:hypothetical protein